MTRITDHSAVLVTGASTGIGRACVIDLASRGFEVFAGVRREEDGRAVCAAAGDAGTRVRPVLLDVTSESHIRDAAAVIEAHVGERGLHGLVNNAGIGVGGPLEFLPAEQLRLGLEVNTLGAMAVTRAVLPLLRRGGRRAPAVGARIVQMSSISGRLAYPMVGPYAASKFALEALSDALRVELAATAAAGRVHVTIVEPGVIATPIWDKGREEGEALWEAMPEEARVRYGAMGDALLRSMERIKSRAIPAERVARVVARAMLDRRPRTRVLVGRDAKIGAAVARVVPDRWRDWLIKRDLLGG